ncbi:MAG: hypothetical protein M3N12_08730 [Verrucomicrobiota bacterium]|nr:hypothetical protein [Verrucomicrobiota bacterium]
MKLIKRFLIPASCLRFSLGAAGSAPSSQPAPVTGKVPLAESNKTREVADKLHTPAEGSVERRALMDALREHYKGRQEFSGQTHRGHLTFRVYYLKVHSGGAWTYAEPHSSDPNDGFAENSGFLLHLTNGRWKVMKLPPMDDNGDGDRDPSARDVERIRKMYPSIPTDIIPGKRR